MPVRVPNVQAQGGRDGRVSFEGSQDSAMSSSQAFAMLDNEGDPYDSQDMRYGDADYPDNEYIPMYDRNLQGEEKAAWDAIVAEEMAKMELEFTKQLNDDSNVTPQLEKKDGKYGIYQQPEQHILDIESVSDNGKGFGSRSNRNHDNSATLEQLAYDRAHPIVIAIDKGSKANANNHRRVRTVQEDANATILSGIGSSALTAEQKKLKQQALAAQAEQDRYEREIYNQQAAIGDEKHASSGDLSGAHSYQSKKPNIDRSYRAQPEQVGDNFSGGLDRLAASEHNRSAAELKQRRQEEYQAQLRSDEEMQRAFKHQQESRESQTVEKSSLSARGNAVDLNAIEQKRLQQQQYREQLQAQTSANAREKASKLAEVHERRMQQQRERDLEILKAEEEAEMESARRELLERQHQNLERQLAMREAAEKQAREENEALAKLERSARQQAAREAHEQGRSLTGQNYISLPMAETSENFQKRVRQQKYREAMERDMAVARSLQGRGEPPIDTNYNRMGLPDEINKESIVLKAPQETAQRRDADVFNGIGAYQSNKEDKDRRRDAQQAYVRALESDRQSKMPVSQRVGLRHLKDEPDHFVQENVLSKPSAPLPRSGLATSIAEPGNRSLESGRSADPQENAMTEKRRQQAEYVKQLQADAQKPTIFSPRKPFVRAADVEEERLEAQRSDRSGRRSTRLREPDGYWPDVQSGAGGLLANGLQSSGPITRQTIKKAAQNELQDQLARDAEQRAQAKALEQQRQQIENHRSARNIGRPNSEVGGPNGGFIGVERTSAAPARVPIRQYSPSQPERTGYPVESLDISTAFREAENTRKRNEYLAQLQADSATPRIAETHFPLHELRKRENLVGGASGALVAELQGSSESQGTGIRIGLATPELKRREKDKLDAYNEARRRDADAKPVLAQRRVSPRRPDPAVQRAQQQAEQLRKLEATGAQLTNSERELLDMYNMSLELESMETERMREYSTYNRQREEYNAGFDASRMGSERLSNAQILGRDDGSEALTRKRQQQQEYVASVEAARNLPPIEQTRVPLLQLQKEQQEQHRASLPGASSVLGRAGSAGAEGSKAPLSARDYQIQRSNHHASTLAHEHAGYAPAAHGTVSDVMAQGYQKNLPNWGRSVGGGPSSFSISGAPPPNINGRGVPATGFTGNDIMQPEPPLSPRSTQIARKGNQAAMRERLYNNPLGY